MGFPRVAPNVDGGSARDVLVRGGVDLTRRRATLGDYDELGGFSLKKVAKNVGKAVVKAGKDVGHGVGAVATSKLGQLATAGVLAATGVGLPAAAAIGAGVQGGGNLIKKGGNLKKAAKGVAVGGAEGAAGSIAGSAIRKAAAARTARSGAKGAAVNAAKPQPPKQATARISAADVGTALVDQAPVSAMVQPIALLPATTGGDTSSSIDNASKVLAMGAKANRGAKQAAAKARNAGSTADKIAAALAKAREVGDAVGATGLSEQLARAQEVAQNASGAAETAARQAEQLGVAAQAAAAGAVGEGAKQSFGDFIKSPVGIAAGVGVLAVGGYMLTRKH